jgi:hypothetical protein
METGRWGVNSMSLWEKWEREKLEKQGVKVEHHSDVKIVKIHETPPKSYFRKQMYVVAGVLVTCLVLVHMAIVFEALYSGRRWSETYIVRLFVAKQEQREAMSNNP